MFVNSTGGFSAEEVRSNPMTRATNTLAWRDLEQECPLVVDLDGTLIRTDMLHESLCRVLRESPLSLCLIPMWLFKGKALLKRQLAACTSIDPGILPYNHDFLDWLRQERTNGRTLVLCTGSDRALAMAIADHLGLFDEVLASNGTVNLAGTQKSPRACGTVRSCRIRLCRQFAR